MKPASCHPEKLRFARGLCNACYHRLRYRTDPAYRERACAKARADYQAIKADPVSYAAKLEYNRNRPEHRARGKA